MKKRNYWNMDTTIDELKKIISELRYFPSTGELLLINRSDLIHAINKHGGIQKFRSLLGYNCKRKAHNAYTEEQKKKFDLELDNIYNTNNKLTSTMLKDIGRNDLINYISQKGGHIMYAEEKGIPHMKESGYWSKEENLLVELKSLITLLCHFPSSTELSKFNCTLRYYISKHGGLNKFRQIFGYLPYHKSNRFWTEENVVSCLNGLIKRYGEFPTNDIVVKYFGNGMLIEMQKNGGIVYYRKKLGYLSGSNEIISTYSHIRGMYAEYLIDIIFDECLNKNGMSVTKNKKFDDNSIVEFYLTHNKSGATACVDVTCTSNYKNITEKWIDRKYHEFSDLLMIVVFSKYLTNKDYSLLNNICPPNVYVVEVKDFIESLKYDYNNVSEEDIDWCINYTFDRYIKEINLGD